MLEVVIAAALLCMALASAAMVSQTGSGAYRTNQAIGALEQTLHRALEQASGQIAATGIDHLEPDPLEGLAYGDLQLQPVVDYTEAGPVLGPTNQLLTQMEAGELADGVDNDGDGLVDERDLLLIRDVGGPNEKRVVLCHGVLEYLEGETFDGTDENDNQLEDEPGFHLERNGNVITLRLSGGHQDPRGEVMVRTAEMSVRMRN